MLLTPFRKNEKVVSLVDLPDVPAGTAGKIKMANGISWHRYWVFFENGVEVGQIDGSLLSRPKNVKAMLENLEGLRQEKLAQKEKTKEQQEVLLDQLLNPPPEPEIEEPKEEAPEEEAASSEPVAAEEVSEKESAEDNSAPAVESAPTPEVSQGNALVDVPADLLQRSAEARTRLQ